MWKELTFSNVRRVNSEYFYQKLQELKESTKSKTSQTTLYTDHEFCDKTKTWLNLSEEQRKCSKLSSAARTKIARKKWTVDAQENIVRLFTYKLHPQQSSITSYCKKTISTPNQASGFLCHVEIDLIDFCKLPCNCSKHQLGYSCTFLKVLLATTT